MTTDESADVIDLNEVRHRTLLGAARDVCEQIVTHLHRSPSWFGRDDRVRWGFALGEAHAALTRALDDAIESSAGTPSLRAYRRVRRTLVRIMYWCVRQSEPRSRHELPVTMAYEAVVDLLAPVLRHADRAPRWLRERGRALSRALPATQR